MKELDLKFEEYPLNVPTEKRLRKKFESLIQELNNCSNAQEAKATIKHWNKFTSQLTNDMSIIFVRYSCDTQNPTYKKAQERCDELSPIISSYSTQFAKILTKASYREELEKEFGKYLFKMYDNSLKSFDDKILNECIEENKLVSEYESVLGSAQVDFRGEKLNLSQLGKYMQDADRATRKEAAITMDKWLGEHEEKIGGIYDKLVKLRTEMAKKLGFENFVELGYLRLGRTDYNALDCQGYRAQIAKEVVPVAQKLYKKQMKALGIKKPQTYDYNLMFASGNAMPAGDAKYLVEQAHKMYSALGNESQVFFEFMQNHHLMDLEARKGKSPGGYCTYFPTYKAPFIFSNFNGTEGDVNVLTHEGGHAFQAYLSRNIKVPEYQSPTLEACEIHSMSMEFLAWPYMEGFFGKDAEKAKYSHLCDAIEFLPYGITIDEFQHWVYEHPEATHEERCTKFKEIETRYTPHKKFDDCPTLNKGTTWLRQSHVFGSPFYYIDYTLAQVVAFQFLIEDQKNHEKTWKKYIKLCKCGGKAPFTELLAMNKLRNPFEEGNVHKNVAPLIKILKGFDVEEF